eukprot:Selendium_serpulae@DN5322_c0_g1_i3.p1
MKYFIVLLIVPAILFYVGYLIMRCDGYLSPKFCAQMHDNAISEGMDLPLPILVVFGVYFIVVNPFIEEYFWRVFLYNVRLYFLSATTVQVMQNLGGLLWYKWSFSSFRNLNGAEI